MDDPFASSDFYRCEEHDWLSDLSCPYCRIAELEEKLRWIPVEERLPTRADADNAFDVLAWGPDGVEMVDIRYQSDLADYTHWMPVPEGPGDE